MCTSGFGVSWTMSQEVQSGGKEYNSANAADDYLFIEEVLYLHERGLLEAYREDMITGIDHINTQEIEDGSPTHRKSRRILLKTFDLYELMLHKLKVPLAIYLTYAHLRSQTYIVLRHTVHRIDILKRLTEEKNKTSSDDATKESVDDKELKILLRYEHFNAQIPHVIRPDEDLSSPNHAVDKRVDFKDSVDDQSWSRLIAFDVYNPNGTFRKTNPGLPDFLVVVCLFNEDSIPFASLLKLVKCCNQIPLRICTVSDGGSLLMFGISDMEVPHINS